MALMEEQKWGSSGFDGGARGAAVALMEEQGGSSGFDGGARGAAVALME